MHITTALYVCDSNRKAYINECFAKRAGAKEPLLVKGTSMAGGCPATSVPVGFSCQYDYMCSTGYCSYETTTTQSGVEFGKCAQP